MGLTYSSPLKKKFGNFKPGNFVICNWSEQLPPLKKTEKHYPPLIVGECKLHEKNVGKDVLDQIITLFDKYDVSVRLFMVAARSFVETISFKNATYCIWIFRRDENKNLNLSLVNSEQKPSAKRHIVLLGLKELYSGSREFGELESRVGAFQRA